MATTEKGFHGGSASSDHADCLKVLSEFVDDVELAYGKAATELRHEWYNLFVTYSKARRLVRD
jgi:hypothetical protein